jgi:hypothetical protein
MKNNSQTERDFGDCLENNVSGNEIRYRLKPLICGTTVLYDDAPTPPEPEALSYRSAPASTVWPSAPTIRRVEKPFSECIENSVDGNEILYRLVPLACVSCYKHDPLPDTPSFGSLQNPYTVSGSIQYGLMPAEEVGEDKKPFVGALQNWDICPTYDFSNGPDQEGVTQDAPYSKRWFVKPEGDGYVYGIDGETSAVVPADLFAGIDFNEIISMSISFDGNAKPCFAFQVVAGTFLLRRYVAGTPTFLSFAGDWPKLFFDGIVQPDNTLTDLVCFYVGSGDVKNRFQRDNFNTERTWLVTAPNPVSRITKTDAFSSRQNLYFFDTLGKFWVARSEVYPLFPIIVSEVSSLGVKPGSGEYFLVVAPGGSYDDVGMIGVIPAGGTYFLIIVFGGDYEDESSLAVIPGTGTYTLVIIDGGSYEETGSVGAKPGGGAYTVAVVDGGSYSESITLGVKPGTGAYI